VSKELVDLFLLIPVKFLGMFNFRDEYATKFCPRIQERKGERRGVGARQDVEEV
jgi:hypothetical protein